MIHMPAVNARVASPFCLLNSVFCLLLAAASAGAQGRPQDLAPILTRPLETPDLVTFQLRQYLYRRIPKLPAPSSAAQWTAETERLRKHLLDDVIFHGWPREWVNAPPSFEDLGVIETGHGYRMRKLRYEIVPGFQLHRHSLRARAPQRQSARRAQRQRPRLRNRQGRRI